ncbi:MAG: glycoside hydrolase family 57 protein [Deltaproteobacteria bacterium]|jgi:alpha-amylase|nr:glycoside hydrolase family 57 protein [Deltaproteobacteria bacterium]
MPSICFYFQVHQPYRIKKFSFFEISPDLYYFDGYKNSSIIKKVAEKCYLPTNNLILNLIDKYQGKFKVAYSITGVAFEQFAQFAPEVIESFKALAQTGCVEFLGETYYHSLAVLYDEEEFINQVLRHRLLIQSEFNQTPQVFRNTELIYDDRIGYLIAGLGYTAILAEGVEQVLGGASPNYIYQAPASCVKLLLKNYGYSDDIAFRFSNHKWKDFPLTPEKFASWLQRYTNEVQTINLFMDYETFGEHQWAETGIFNFLRELPEKVLSHPAWQFKTPSETIRDYNAVAEISFKHTTSWADAERDLSAWQGNRMQKKALKAIYSLKNQVYATQNHWIIETYKKLQTSDHFYYMSNKFKADGDVHAYFSPFDSPFDAFIYYMNVLKDFKTQVIRENY